MNSATEFSFTDEVAKDVARLNGVVMEQTNRRVIARFAERYDARHAILNIKRSHNARGTMKKGLRSSAWYVEFM